MIKNILHRVKCARYTRKICLSHVLLFSCTTYLRHIIIHFLVLYGRGAALHTKATPDHSVLPQWSKPLKIDGKDEFKRDMNIIWSKMRILACIATYSSLFILLNYISFRSTQSFWEKYVWSEDRLLTLGRNQDVFWENNLFEGIGKFSFPLEPLPSIIAQLKTHLIQLRKQNLNKTKANKQTNKETKCKQKSEDGESRTLTYAIKRRKKKEKTDKQTIVGFRMTSLKNSNHNYPSYGDFTFMVY